MAENSTRYRTWSQNRSVRLPEFDYREHVPYHVTVCAWHGMTPFANIALATMVCESLSRLCDEYRAYLGAFCLMPDHLHILLSPDRSGLTLGDLIGRVKGSTTNQSWKLGWSGKLWQPRFYDHIVRKSEGVAEVARYIFENPERKELRNDYPFRFVDDELA
ncbi:MAG: transposase [Phycisphaerales bacterium]|nr:MAG: transposase [Phycisphaerales bacterium]